jgi:hypothetical protein
MTRASESALQAPALQQPAALQRPPLRTLFVHPVLDAVSAFDLPVGLPGGLDWACLLKRHRCWLAEPWGGRLTRDPKPLTVFVPCHAV